MKPDFSSFAPIPFAQYEADMRETSEQAAAIIEHQAREIRELKRGVAALVLAAGGRLVVSEDALHELPEYVLEVELDVMNRQRIFRARRAAHA